MYKVGIDSLPPGMAIAINWTLRHCHTSTPTGGRGGNRLRPLPKPKTGDKPTGQAGKECSVQVGSIYQGQAFGATHP